MRTLCLILGDQLDRRSPVFDDFDRRNDILFMAEVAEESTHVRSHKQRIALFLSAMRLFAAELSEQGYPMHYLKLDEHPAQSLAEALDLGLQAFRPERVRLVLPGEYRVLADITSVCRRHRVALNVLEDRHFLSTPAQFGAWAAGRKTLRMEYWYRYMRKRHHVLMTDTQQPAGGRWNFDQANRKSFASTGPEMLPPMPVVQQDAMTRGVIQFVNERFAGHPGVLEQLNWPVTPAQAESMLTRFLDHALPSFGDYQDAMWADRPYLYHSLLASSLNLKLLDPGKVIAQAENRYLLGEAPLAAVEGFVRQILGWREFVRGLYWMYMPEWRHWNALQARNDLPGFYWTGETNMNCLREVIGQTLTYGYAHHIQRLMVTGLFALLFGVEPRQVHEWYLAVYVDAVEWVELPNTLGMSQYADDGIMASKPYVASGKYIDRMSNYCKNCRYDPGKAAGKDACPITTLYWDFLDRHQNRFQAHPRMGLMLTNLRRKPSAERDTIRRQAALLQQFLI